MPQLLGAALSDPPSPAAEAHWTEVAAFLAATGWSLGPQAPRPGLWADPAWTLVADPTGGSRTIEGLPDLVAGLGSPDPAQAGVRGWWSMSDNSLVLNTLVDRGLCRIFHGHPLTLAGRDAAAQRHRFVRWSSALAAGQPFPADLVPPVQPLAGLWPGSGAVVGGNLTALERLGATPWRPRPRGRVLLVESLSAPATEAGHRVSALVSDPWWADIGGLLIGRFTAADRQDPGWIERLLTLVPAEVPVARWPLVGHGADAWTVPLAEELGFTRV